MTEPLTKYARFIHADQSVLLCISCSYDKEFAAPAVVKSLQHDLIVLKLTAPLPEQVPVTLGSILNLRITQANQSYCCMAVVIDDCDPGSMPLRLISDVVAEEKREFFRTDVFIPLKYILPPVSSAAEAEREWLKTRRMWDGAGACKLFAPHRRLNDLAGAELPVSGVPWEEMLPVAANLSGGGLRITIAEKMQPNDLLNVQFYLPLTPPRVVESVAMVISSEPEMASGDSRPLYNTRMRFLFIEEEDRERIIKHISLVELQRSRPLMHEPAVRKAKGAIKLALKRPLLAAIILLVIISAFLLIHGFPTAGR